MGAALRRALVQSWQHRGPLALLLWPVAAVFGLLVALRTALYRHRVLPSQHAGVPVIVVGNVTAGGSGKTPVVMALVRHLQMRGHRPGVLSRGYGRSMRDCREVLPDSTADAVGDEPLLIARATAAPVAVAPARIDAAGLLTQRHPDVDVLVCDDGLQHHGLQRDIEICVFDERGPGNGWLLPAGPLREPWPRPVDLLLQAGEMHGGPGFALRRTLARHAIRSDGSAVALDVLYGGQRPPSGRPVHAVAGIARPEMFFAMLRAQGIRLDHVEALPDHAAFDAPGAWKQAGNEILLCTEKDAPKLWRLRPDAWAVPLLLEIEAAFWDRFDVLLAQAGAKLSSAHGHTSS